MVTAQRPCAGGEEAPREKLNAFFAEHPRLAIAFSGGLDSRFLCFSALRAGASVLALHARGPHIPEYETREAVDFAENLHLPLIVFDTDPLTLPDAAHNTKRRCYACKKNLLSRIRTLLAERGETERTLCDGTNHSDLAVFRPGLLALQEEGVLSPLALSGYDKPLIREKAVEEGMALPSFPPRPCLLTRYAYGLCPERAVLAALGRAEKKLLDLKNGEGGRLLGFPATPHAGSCASVHAFSARMAGTRRRNPPGRGLQSLDREGDRPRERLLRHGKITGFFRKVRNVGTPDTCQFRHIRYICLFSGVLPLSG